MTQRFLIMKSLSPFNALLKIMGFVVPILNRDFDDIRQEVRARIKEEKWQRRLVLIIVSTALLLDNMLYMVIVPIIPDYLRRIGAYKVKYSYQLTNDTVGSENGTEYFVSKLHKVKEYESEDTSLGYLFASKAIIQLLVNPFSGALIDRIGYEIPMIIGLVIMFSSTAIFALGQSYGILFFARSLQGLGSAFADTSGLAMIANRFTEEAERSKALGIALAFISFGSLVAPPFGGVLYEFCGKPVPFLLLSFVCLLDGFMVFMVIHPKTQRAETGERIKGPTVFRLLLDPYIAICAGALVTANVSLAFLEPTISKWMTDTMPTVTEWQIGLVWLPPFLPHVLGVYVAVKLLKRYSQISWLLAAVGLGLEGISCFIVPFATTYTGLIIPLSILCFGISLVDTALLPLLGYLVDTRHASVYGSVYAIADISYSIAYAIGPVVAGTVVANLGFFSLNLIICLSNVLYAPALSFIRSVYSYKPFENDFDDDYKRDVSFNESEFYGSLENQHFDPKQPGHQYSYDQVDSSERSYQNQFDPFEKIATTKSVAQNPSVPIARSNIRPRPPPPPPAQYRLLAGQNSLSIMENMTNFKTLSTKENNSQKSFNRTECQQRVCDICEVLPKPPVPELKDTLEKYVKYAGVVADNKSQLFQTERFVEHFYRTEGPQLQKRLEEIAEKSSNWINHFWLKTMYLENRAPLPLYSNPGYAFEYPNFHNNNKDALFKYIALFIQGLFDFKAVVDRRELPSDYSTGLFGGSPMCMEQFWYLFSSYRHPRLGVDTLEQFDTNTEHITVMCNNQIYIMAIMKDGKIIDQDNLARQLATIKFMADKSVTSNHWPVGFITAVNRDKASLAYKILEKDPINRKSLEDIKRSAFVVCLDESLQSDNMMSKDYPASSSSLSYMISTVNNRWFDKTFQFIFTEDGRCGVNYEHSVAEGMPMFKMVDHALNYTKSKKSEDDNATKFACYQKPRPLCWNLNEQMRDLVTDCKEEAMKISKSLNIEILHYTGYGKQFIKSVNASPDAIVQMALQWTFFKCHGKLTSTYETASLRRFKQGRVENLRSATPETLNWVKQMENENATMAVTGYGIDNHLWALKDISLQMCDIMPKIFSDALFRELFTFRLSTSQIPWLPDNAAVGYGPVVDDGYGCAYKLSDNSIKFFISTLNISDKTNITEFHHTLKTTLDQFQIFLSSFEI
ncbi:Vesicular acetylcholine transporter unc-17 [Trichinella papuae]|uniref:Choline O-acetyltransferase n=1 Tax=Trichinella papuae TaxID=268474 RepID=A0A0V1MB75_9BILA|nr:Vesicular acetylcholine transporter unc-17 [Trichinella papuae]